MIGFAQILLISNKPTITTNLDHVSLNNQSYYSLDVIEFQSELCDTHWAFIDTIGMNEKCRQLNPTDPTKVSDFSYKMAFFCGNLKK